MNGSEQRPNTTVHSVCFDTDMSIEQRIHLSESPCSEVCVRFRPKVSSAPHQSIGLMPKRHETCNSVREYQMKPWKSVGEHTARHTGYIWNWYLIECVASPSPQHQQIMKYCAKFHSSYSGCQLNVEKRKWIAVRCRAVELVAPTHLQFHKFQNIRIGVFRCDVPVYDNFACVRLCQCRCVTSRPGRISAAKIILSSSFVPDSWYRLITFKLCTSFWH